MAPFVNLDVSYDIEKEPNFLGYSRGGDVPRSLAEGNTSLGRLFGNIGESVDAFAKGAYGAINQGIKDDARSELEPIINSMGGDLQPADAPLVAGTGARGAKYQAAVGATGLGTPTDLAPDTAKLPSDFQGNVDRVKQLKAAYEAGALSDTRYKTESSAIFQKLRARYGMAWSDEIDSAIRDVNNTPANDVRRAVLNDMISMSAASQSSQNKLLTLYNENAKYLPIVEPGITPEKFASNPYHYLAEVSDLKAQDYALDRQKATLALQKDQSEASKNTAYSAYQTEANQHVSNIIRSTMGGMQAEGARLIAKGSDVKPQELEAFASKARALYAVVSNQLDARARAPLSVSGYTDTGSPIPSDVSYAKYLKAGDMKEIRDQALAPMATIIEAVGVKDFTAATAAADLAKWQGNSDFIALTKNIPSIRAYPAIRKAVGDQAMTNVLEMSKGQILEPLTKAVTDTGWLNVYHTGDNRPPPAASEILSATSGTNPQNPGKVNRTVLAGLKEMAQHDNPEIGGRAVESIYGDPKLFAATPSDQKTKIYTFLGSNDFTNKMLALRDKNPQAWETYSNWMEKNFRAVFPEAVSDAQSAINFEHYNWSMDPKTLAISAESKAGYASSFFPDPAPEYVSKMNNATQLLAPILKEKYGEQAASKLLELSGINPNAPKTGSFMEEMDKKLKSLTGATPSKGPAGEKPAPGKQSDAGTAEVTPVQTVANVAHTSETWGNPLQRGFKSEHLAEIATPSGKKLQVNKVAAEAFQGFLQDLEATGYQIKDIGGYSLRTNKADPGRLSQHAWGNAIDINPGKNAFGSRKSDLPKNVGELAAKWGLTWGGNWRHPDPMHFEYTGNKSTKKASNEDFLTPAG